MCQGADKVSGTDFGHIGRRKPFSVPDTFSILISPNSSKQLALQR